MKLLVFVLAYSDGRNKLFTPSIYPRHGSRLLGSNYFLFPLLIVANDMKETWGIMGQNRVVKRPILRKTCIWRGNRGEHLSYLIPKTTEEDPWVMANHRFPVTTKTDIRLIFL